MILPEIQRRFSRQSSRPRRAPVKREPIAREDPRLQTRGPSETISLPLPVPTLLEAGKVAAKVKEDTPPEKEHNNSVSTTTRATAVTAGMVQAAAGNTVLEAK